MSAQDVDTKSENAYDDSELHTAQSFMYKDTPLTPKMISSLMHVETTLQSTQEHETEEQKNAESSVLYTMGIIFASLGIAAVVGTSFLYFHKIGPFYDPVEASFLL